MTNFTTGRLLLVAIAIVALALLAPVVSAHGNDTTADDAPPYDGTVDDWATWMEAHMTDHMGPDAVEWMESHVGVTVDEVARDVAGGGNTVPADDSTGDDYPVGPGSAGGMYGEGHC